MSYVYYRSHGGLGNQLFQLFYAMLLSDLRAVHFVHDDKYRHGFKWGLPDSAITYGAYGWQKYILMMKIPKILKKIGLSNKGYISLGGSMFLDGYFQDVYFYDKFDKDKINVAKDLLKKMCAIDESVRYDDELFHIRLGDFFESEKDEVYHAAATIDKLRPGSFVISNRDDLFVNDELCSLCNGRNIKYIPTDAFAPLDLLRFMSGFKVINSNGSTIAFWSGILGDKDVKMNDRRLDLLFKFLR